MGSSVSNATTYIRQADHAGSWYASEPVELNRQLENFLSQAQTSDNKDDSAPSLRAVVVPHAGYSYSGPTAASAYQCVLDEFSKKDCPLRRIVVLHPSHHVYLDGCAVSGAKLLATPLGSLTVDDELRQEVLKFSPKVTVMTQSVDEHEHSGEMQYPYLAKVLRDTQRTDVTVLPIMCGALSIDQERAYGTNLAPILVRPDVLTVVSTDFCHWGKRFSYQPTDKESLPIHEFIELMDRRGMDLIQLQLPGAFADYLKQTRNTICGRHAISVWLQSVEASNSSDQMDVRFVRYEQSSAVQSMSDSSVSYAAAVATLQK